MKREGSITFERPMSGVLAIRQGWNPSNLNNKERRIIINELREIATQMERGKFEVDGEYVPRPTDEDIYVMHEVAAIEAGDILKPGM